MGDKRLVSIDGGWSCHYCIISLVSAERARNLLWIFSASHNLGEFLSFIFVGSVVGWLGWQAGFVGSFIAGAIGVVIIIFFLHDSPESRGLPHVGNPPKESTNKAQKGVLKNPYVWILALASAFMYVSRYAVNSWGVRFLEMEKGIRWNWQLR